MKRPSILSIIPLKPDIFSSNFQEESRRGPVAGTADSGAQRTAEEGRRGTRSHLSHLPQNQVRRRHRSHLQLLHHPMLRQVRRKGHLEIWKGKMINLRIKLKHFKENVKTWLPT